MSLYLSRLILNSRSRQVWAELAQPYEMHRTLMRAFPGVAADADKKAREAFAVLFRADVDERDNTVKVYIQSSNQPDWSYLESLDGYLVKNTDDPNPAWKNISDALQKIKAGQVFSFRLRANPTKRLAGHSKEKDGNPAGAKWIGKRIELVREEDQIAWLIRKAKEREKEKPGGFEIVVKKSEGQDGKERLIPCLNVHPEGKLRGRKRDEGQGHEMKHFAVLYEGLLRVRDANAFRDTLISGIGPGKAYGFGLLSIAPVNRADHAD